MRKLRPDAFARRTFVPRQRGTRPGRLFLLMFVSVAMLLLSRLQHGYIVELRLQLAELLAPALKVALVPLEPVRRFGQRVGAHFELFNELDRLRAENQRLRGWEWRARETERRANQLARLANVIEEPGVANVTARVVADSSGPFVRTVMLGIGREGRMKFGFPVIDENGLVGRILETGASVSRVLLVTDFNSRVPVQIGRQGVRGVLLGDNGPTPRLGYLPATAQIDVGDEVSTSGVGGLFPRGLRIGTVIDDAGSFRIKPHVRFDELDYVTVLIFESPTIDGMEEEKAQRLRDTPLRRSGYGRPTSEQGMSVP